MLKNDFSIVISAPSGAGKTTLIKKLMVDNKDLEFSVSTTTRSKRNNEIDGESYCFIDTGKFKEMINNEEFIEWAEVHGNYYGTEKKEIDRIKGLGRIPIFDVDVQGSKILKNQIDEAIYIFIIPPSLKVLKDRLINRKTDTDNQIKIRLNNAKKELRQFDIYDYVIINDDLNEAVNKLKSVIIAETCKINRISQTIKEIMEDESDNTTR